MKSTGILSAAVGTAFMAGAPPASAADFDFFYGAQHVARMTTSHSTSTSFSFSFLAAPDAGAFVNDILLDMDKGAFANTTGGATTPTYEFKEKGFEGTGMQTKISFPTKGNGTDRFAVGETATWSIDGVYDGPARLHLNAFFDGKSIKLTPVVPEPEAYAMALVALGVLGAFGWLRRGKR